MKQIEKKKNRMHQKIKDITSKHIKKEKQNMTEENFKYCQNIRKGQKKKMYKREGQIGTRRIQK